jgi:hypothetical protein
LYSRVFVVVRMALAAGATSVATATRPRTSTVVSDASPTNSVVPVASDAAFPVGA